MNSKTLGILAVAAVALLVASTIAVYLTPDVFAQDNRGQGGNGGRGGDSIGGVNTIAGDDVRANQIRR